MNKILGYSLGDLAIKLKKEVSNDIEGKIRAERETIKSEEDKERVNEDAKRKFAELDYKIEVISNLILLLHSCIILLHFRCFVSAATNKRASDIEFG